MTSTSLSKDNEVKIPLDGDDIAIVAELYYNSKWSETFRYDLNQY